MIKYCEICLKEIKKENKYELIPSTKIFFGFGLMTYVPVHQNCLEKENMKNTKKEECFICGLPANGIYEGYYYCSHGCRVKIYEQKLESKKDLCVTCYQLKCRTINCNNRSLHYEKSGLCYNCILALIPDDERCHNVTNGCRNRIVYQDENLCGDCHNFFASLRKSYLNDCANIYCENKRKTGNILCSGCKYLKDKTEVKTNFSLYCNFIVDGYLDKYAKNALEKIEHEKLTDTLRHLENYLNNFCKGFLLKNSFNFYVNNNNKWSIKIQ